MRSSVGWALLKRDSRASLPPHHEKTAVCSQKECSLTPALNLQAPGGLQAPGHSGPRGGKLFTVQATCLRVLCWQPLSWLRGDESGLPTGGIWASVVPIQPSSVLSLFITEMG